jgi:hypothetical protein
MQFFHINMKTLVNDRMSNIPVSRENHMRWVRVGVQAERYIRMNSSWQVFPSNLASYWHAFICNGALNVLMNSLLIEREINLQLAMIQISSFTRTCLFPVFHDTDVSWSQLK